MQLIQIHEKYYKMSTVSELNDENKKIINEIMYKTINMKLLSRVKRIIRYYYSLINTIIWLQKYVFIFHENYRVAVLVRQFTVTNVSSLNIPIPVEDRPRKASIFCTSLM